jgi:hypothetical protein
MHFRHFFAFALLVSSTDIPHIITIFLLLVVSHHEKGAPEHCDPQDRLLYSRDALKFIRSLQDDPKILALLYVSGYLSALYPPGQPGASSRALFGIT